MRAVFFVAEGGKIIFDPTARGPETRDPRRPPPSSRTAAAAKPSENRHPAVLVTIAIVAVAVRAAYKQKPDEDDGVPRY